MDKKPRKFFRFLRGELNGFYLKNLAYFLNNWVDKNIMEALSYMKNVQFIPEAETEAGKGMTDEDIINIAKTAGIVQSITLGRMVLNTFKMPISELKDGNTYENYKDAIVISNPLEVSERGLWEKKSTDFNFSFWNTQDKEDIVDNISGDLATKFQSPLVPEGQPVLGYIREGSIIYDEEGNLLPEEQWLLSTPPENAAYSNFYGKQFLHLEEDFVVRTEIPTEVVYQIFLAIQEVRYNGASVKSLAKLTEIVVGDIVKIGDHLYNVDEPQYIIWYYVVNKEGPDVRPYPEVRLNVWLNLVANFFPQIRMEEKA